MAQSLILRVLAVVFAVCLLSACLDKSPSTQAPAIDVAAAGELLLAGSPATQAAVGISYEFQPEVSSTLKISFSVTNLPSWATFDPATGRVSGVPQARHLGMHDRIVITAYDGLDTLRIGPFAIQVSDTFPGAATLSWMPPTENEDGTAIRSLAGYRVNYGRNPAYLDHEANIDNPAVTRYVVENLAPGAWYFALVTLSMGNTESDQSAIVSKTIH